MCFFLVSLGLVFGSWIGVVVVAAAVAAVVVVATPRTTRIAATRCSWSTNSGEIISGSILVMAVLLWCSVGWGVGVGLLKLI